MNILDSIAKRKSATFANFIYKTKETGELAQYSIILEADTYNLYKKDIPKLERAIRLLTQIGAAAHTIQAAQELLDSRNESLTNGVGNNDAYTNKNTYDHVDGFRGVRVHCDTGDLYVSGLVEHKKTIKAGTPRKPVKSSPKTISKNRLRYIIPSGRFRQFALPNVKRAAVNGDVLELITEEAEG